MLLNLSDVETFNNCLADQAQLIENDTIPLLPAGRTPRPRGPLRVPGLIVARHWPSRY